MIEVKNLYKGYGNKKAPVLKDINMKVEKGTIHGLIGHNGSGKTTLIKFLNGIYRPDAGEVLYDGEPVYDNAAVKEKIGYVADSNQLFAGYRLSELLRFFSSMYPKFSMDDFEALNRIFQVDTRKRIRNLSKGQQMRVSFMLNTAINPEVMILDEPTSGLDAIAKHDLLELLVSQVENRGTTIIISSHNLNELEKICDSVTILKNGQIDVEDGIEEVKERIGKYQVVFPNGAPDTFYKLDDIVQITNVGSVYTVIVKQSDNDFEQQAKESGAILVEAMPVDLEEVFVQMNKGGEKDDKQSTIPGAN